MDFETSEFHYSMVTPLYLISHYLHSALRDFGSPGLCETFWQYHNMKWYLHINISIYFVFCT